MCNKIKEIIRRDKGRDYKYGSSSLRGHPPFLFSNLHTRYICTGTSQPICTKRGSYIYIAMLR